MKENKFNTEQEFENMLKDKMNELSDSVNCFDKIAERAFPEGETEFEDSEFIVSDLENITGRKRFSPVFRFAAVGTAAVLILGIIPRTSLFRNVMYNLGSENSSLYDSVVSDLMRDTDENSGMDFCTYDMELDEYIKKDVLVTPLYSCPFEDIGREDVRVRIFIRQHNDILTNQMYAVEYSGEYSEENFIAAAETSASFSEEEFNNIHHLRSVTNTLAVLSSANASLPYMMDTKEAVGASFTQNITFKGFNEVYPVMLNVSYATADNGESYIYDTTAFRIYSETENPAINQFNIPQSDVKWKYSLYANGESALPDESGSIFTKVTDKQYNKLPIPYFISPYDQTTTPVANGISSVFITLMNKNIDTPFDGNSKSIMNIFLTETDMMAFYLSSQMPAEITVHSSDGIVDREYLQTDISSTSKPTEWTGSITITDDNSEDVKTSQQDLDNLNEMQRRAEEINEQIRKKAEEQAKKQEAENALQETEKALQTDEEALQKDAEDAQIMQSDDSIVITSDGNTVQYIFPQKEEQ